MGLLLGERPRSDGELLLQCLVLRREAGRLQIERQINRVHGREVWQALLRAKEAMSTRYLGNDGLLGKESHLIRRRAVYNHH